MVNYSLNCQDEWKLAKNGYVLIGTNRRGKNRAYGDSFKEKKLG
jgi:hypothetical protein